MTPSCDAKSIWSALALFIPGGAIVLVIFQVSGQCMGHAVYSIHIYNKASLFFHHSTLVQVKKSKKSTDIQIIESHTCSALSLYRYCALMIFMLSLLLYFP